MAKKTPKRLEEAQKFSICEFYRDRWICVYAGSRKHHGMTDMFWAMLHYNAEGDRIADGYLPSDQVLDIADALAYCKQALDSAIARDKYLQQWENKPLDYEEVRLWRDICEFLVEKGYPCDRSDFAQKFGYTLDPLISPDRTRRQLLWNLYKIQLITWDSGQRRSDPSGWKLKGNWEDKIWFLEQVYLMGKCPSTLPKRWLEKAKPGYRKRLYDRLKHLEYDILYEFFHLDWSVENGYGESKIRRIREAIAKTKACLKEIQELNST